MAIIYEMLVKAVDHSHPDPEIDRRGCYKKGDIVVVRPAGHKWGAKETLPKFVVVKIDDSSLENSQEYESEWRRFFEIEVLSANPNNATYQARISCTNPGVSGQANLTREQVEGYLNNWGATVDSIDINQVTFTVALWNTLRSNGFWDADVSLIGFTLVSYVNPTAIVDINISGVLAFWTPKMIADRVESRGGAIISYTEPVGRFSIDRQVVLSAFSEDLKSKLTTAFTRRQYYFSESDVDIAIANGGTMTITKTQFLNRVNSKLDL